MSPSPGTDISARSFDAVPVAGLTLADAPLNGAYAVLSLQAPATAPYWLAWLEEIGFLPGEWVMVTARGVPGGDPLVVRVGSSTFALRRAEAGCVLIAKAPA